MSFLRKNLPLSILCGLSLFAFLVTTYGVVTGQSFMFDSAVYKAIVNFHRGPLTNIMLAISQVLHPTVLILSTAIFFCALMFFRKKLFAYYFLCAMGAGVGSSTLFKVIFSVVRPVSDLTTAIGWSYPSGHATAAAVFFITLLYAIEKKISDRTVEVLFALVSISLIVLTAFSRVYLGVHWTSDVFAGLTLGTFWATVSILMLKSRLDSHESNHS